MEAGTGDTTYAVVMIDLDDLKEVNDTYGHESGDQYIISAAEILKKIVGESGLTARHGGDEFVLFLEEKSEEALQEKLLQLKSAQDSSEAVLHDGQHVPLRFSMGCCFIDEVFPIRTLIPFKIKHNIIHVMIPSFLLPFLSSLLRINQ